MSTYEQTSLMFKALGEPVRLAIISMLAGSEMCACELLKELSISQPTLSHHMKILSAAGLVHVRKEATWMHYSIHQSTLAELGRFITAIEKAPPKQKTAQCSTGSSCT